MQTSRTSLLFLLVLACLISGPGCSNERALDPAANMSTVELSKSAPTVYDPWQLAEMDYVTDGPDLDLLGRRALGIDDFGTLHAIYQRGIGTAQTLFYVSKPLGGEWSEPEIVGPAGTYPGEGWLEVRKETGEAYVAFYEQQTIRLGIRRAGNWEFHTLNTPPEYGVAKPAMTIDEAGRAHLALLVNWSTPIGTVIWQIAYGYFDGSPDLHFQLLERSFVPHYGLFANPDIVVRPDGSVAIAYWQEQDSQYLIMVEDNNQLGGTEWNAETVDVPGVIVYPQSLEIDSHGYLHIALHTNIELGAEHHVYYSVRRDGAFRMPTEVGGDYTGARPRLAVTADDVVHIVFEELLGPRTTGRIIYAYKDRGEWYQNVILEGAAINPSFVIDSQGNGNVLFERQLIILEDSDIHYFGFVGPLP